jgi:hypothetical protein
LAIGSYVEKYSNSVEIVKKRPPVAASLGKSTMDYTTAGVARSRDDEEELEEDPHLGSLDVDLDRHNNNINNNEEDDDPNHPSFYDSTLFRAGDFDHPYPCTKIMWSPDVSLGAKDLLATTGDYLRVWEMVDDESGRGTLIPKKEALLNNVSTTACITASDGVPILMVSLALFFFASNVDIEQDQ